MTQKEARAEINALKQLLANSDYKALKHADGVMSDAEYEETKQLRQKWREKINEYESKMDELPDA